MTDESRAAAALFQEFETVVNSKATLLSSVGTGISKQDMGALQAPFAYLFSGLKAVDEHAASEIMSNAEAVLLGARDFRSPEGIGAVESQFCYVVVFGGQRPFDASKYFRSGSTTSQEQKGVWTWSARLSGEPLLTIPLYATQIEHSYLLLSTGLSELQSVAKWLDRSSTTPPVLEHIRQWDLISQHPLWAYRRYEWSRPANRIAAGLVGIPRDSEALMLFLDPGSAACILRLVEVGEGQDTAGGISLMRDLPSFNSLGAGIWQSMIPLAGDEQTLRRLLRIMQMFGFGLFL
jgi:hypothetical protein